MSQNQVFCPSCGAAVTPGAQFCRTCGKPIPAEGARPPGTPVPSSTPPVVLPAVPLPAPVPGAAAVPSRKGSPTLLFVIGGLALVCICLVCGIGGIWIIAPGPGGTRTPEAVVATLSRSDAVQIGIEGGKVSLEGGAEIEVPAGAVQPNADGSVKKVPVTITKDPPQSVSLRSDLASVGPVYQLGPDGVTFAVPVRIALPIPEGVDPARVRGLTTLDRATGKWVGVPGAVDAEARKVSAETAHFSSWSVLQAVGPEDLLFQIWNYKAAYNRPTAPTTFVIAASYNVTEITTYHWNVMKGAPPGTIWLQAEDGTTYGPWKAIGLPGQDPVMSPYSGVAYEPGITPQGVANAYWVVKPNVLIPAGTYTVLDSDPETWSQNIETRGKGMAWGKGIRRPTETPTRATASAVATTTRPSTPAVATTTRPSTPLLRTETPAGTITPQGAGSEETLFEVKSSGGADTGASPTIFTIRESWKVTEITTYHWNNGRGAKPGTIGLRAQDGTAYGPWSASGLPGQGGVANAYWVVKPNVIIPPGTYSVLDSDPGTWAQNSETLGKGMAWGKGIRIR